MTNGETHPFRTWLPLAAWTVMILSGSGPAFGTSRTAAVLHAVASFVAGHEVPYAQLEELHFLLRKSAHAVVYGIEGLLAFHAIRGTRPGFRGPWAMGALTIALAVASADELRQSRYAARTGTAWDVLLDVAGAAVALAIASVVARRRAAPGRPPRARQP